MFLLQGIDEINEQLVFEKGKQFLVTEQFNTAQTITS